MRHSIALLCRIGLLALTGQAWANPPPKIDASQFQEGDITFFKDRLHGRIEKGSQDGDWLGPAGEFLRNGSETNPVTCEAGVNRNSPYCYGHTIAFRELLLADFDPQKAESGAPPPNMSFRYAMRSDSTGTLHGASDYRSWLTNAKNRQAFQDVARNSLQNKQDYDDGNTYTAESPAENLEYAAELQRRLDLGLLPSLGLERDLIQEDGTKTRIGHAVLLKQIEPGPDGSSFLHILDSNSPTKTKKIHMNAQGEILSMNYPEKSSMSDEERKSINIGIGAPFDWQGLLGRSRKSREKRPTDTEEEASSPYSSH